MSVPAEIREASPAAAGAESLASERDTEVLRSFARRIDPTDAGAHNNLGVLYYNKGLYEEAVGAFMRALELDSRMQVAQRNLEIAYLSSGAAASGFGAAGSIVLLLLWFYYTAIIILTGAELTRVRRRLCSDKP